MWLTSIMMLLFGAAMLSLAADMGKRFYGKRRQLVSGGIALSATASSLLYVLYEWLYHPSQSLVISPSQNPLSTLYLVDSFSIFIVLTVLVVGTAVSCYAMLYLDSRDNSGPFFALLLIMLCSLVGVSSAGDLLSLFLFWEGMSITAYGLVSFRKGRGLALEATVKYFFLAGTGSLLALYGVSIIYSITGSIALSALSLPAVTSSEPGLFGILLLVTGFGVEAAVVPLHTWLPDVYSSAPTPVAAMISGAVTGTGMFALVKVIQPIAQASAHPAFLQGVQEVIVLLAAVTMLVGNLSALMQSNLRRMLGFSSVAQTGYMLAALSTLSVPGLIAIVFNIWNHGLLKSNFFMLAGRDDEYASTELGELAKSAGGGRLRPFMYTASSLGMVGSPPFGLFWSELLIVQSLLLAGGTMFTLLAVLVVANIVLSIGYYFRVITSVVFAGGVGSPAAVRLREAAVPLVLLVLSIFTGIVPGLFIGHIALLGTAIP